MKYIEDIAALEALYGTPGAASIRKVAGHLTPAYGSWISRSKFCILSTVGPEGTDATPRGDVGPVVMVLDQQTLALPDWHGNNRIDALRNIVRDPRVSLMFMVTGSNNVVRVNGTAQITDEPEMTSRFERKTQHPRSVIIVQIEEIYLQCARALLRAGLWGDGDQSAGLPTVGDILSELTDGAVGGADYDSDWPDRAAKTMW
ncbi:MAG: pyridoxamine 5'-phosphate oxidase family protein [Paracoccaceae bacterium]